MLKLLSLNIERDKHYDLIFPFFDSVQADVLCLQEAPEGIRPHLHAKGYCTAYLPMFTKETSAGIQPIGILIASRSPMQVQSHYYHQPQSDRRLTNKEGEPDTRSFGYLIAETTKNNVVYRVATTHFWDSVDGRADPVQEKLMPRLLTKLGSELPHVLCGDFNIPRHHNHLYETLVKHYTDTIPQEYQSSLDRNLHRLGNKVIDQPIFDEYMVDYILTKPPYVAHDTTLHFGVSDHAAITTTLTIQP